MTVSTDLLTRSLTRSQPQATAEKQNRADPLYRDLGECSIRALEGDGNERRFTLSFSSEEPYERWWGVEILDHADGAVDLSRLNDIGCLLFNHNRDVVIGKITRAWIEENRGFSCAKIRRRGAEMKRCKNDQF